MISNVPSEIIGAYVKKGYWFVGKHSGLKPCRWLSEKIWTGRRACYKERFYGIGSHQCIQCTPALYWCTHRCKFCWRVEPSDIGIYQDLSTMENFVTDDPKELADKLIEKQKEVILRKFNLEKLRKNYELMVDIVELLLNKEISFYSLVERFGVSVRKVRKAIVLLNEADVIQRKKPNNKVMLRDNFNGRDRGEGERIVEENVGSWKDIEKCFHEALKPKHAAISLAGEPTLYPAIGELIEAFHTRNLTTFLVTNGTNPQVLNSLEQEPTQLYLTLAAPDLETYRKVCRPVIKNGWKRLLETIETLKTHSCRKCIRITAVKHMNLHDPDGYGSLINKAEPDFFEVKGFTYVGAAQERLQKKHEEKGMTKLQIRDYYEPTHKDIRDFAEKLGDITGYPIVNEVPVSRAVLLSNWPKKGLELKIEA